MRYIPLILALSILLSCNDDTDPGVDMPIDLTHIPFDTLTFKPEIPEGFPILEQPMDNPLTVQGVSLGRDLFYDPILSLDSTISCASCHFPELSFTDARDFSVGVHGGVTARSSMSLLNVGFYYNDLFWDGRASNLEEQAFHPIVDEIEMDNTWDEVEIRLRRSEHYPEKFRKAFGILNTAEITQELATKALAQFERSLISSGNSKFDKVMRGQAGFTPQEQLGFDIFFDDDPELPDGECFHCHSGSLFTNNDYMNNGLDAADDFNAFSDKGRGAVTGEFIMNGKFRVPTLRNIEFTAPYMHDGRFNTLEEVLHHYNSGGQVSEGKDALIVPLGLNEEQLDAVRAFLSTLNDEDFLHNDAYSNPH